MSTPTVESRRWLYGPIPDLLLGCGLLYILLSLAFALQGKAAFDQLPIAVPALLVALISAPHYGATLLRVYEKREDRQAYFLFSVVATAALLALFAVALVDHWTGSVIATVYLTWAGWHYTGQNFGISVMFLRRRGIEFEGLSRRMLHTSFLCSYLLVFLDMHGAASPVADPSVEIRLIPLAIPEAVNDLVFPVVGIAYLSTTIASAGMLARRAARLADLLPVLVLAVVQASWWSIPYAMHFFELEFGLIPLSWDSRTAFFPWIACAHALQYLWVSSFYVRSSEGWRSQAHYYLAVLMAGSAIWALPPILFAPGLGGFDWNFALLLAAIINIHHFILDGVIWKLRHSTISKVLIFDEREGDARKAARGWPRRMVWAVAAMGLVFAIHSRVERFIVLPAARGAGDLEAVAASLDRQVWHATTSAHDRFTLGRRFEERGDYPKAIAQYEISAGMENRVEPLRRLIVLYRNQGDPVGFVRSCDRLFAFDGVERPMPSPIVSSRATRVPRAYVEGCLHTVQTVRPGKVIAEGRVGTAEAGLGYR